jgi:hypothetical protein
MTVIIEEMTIQTKLVDETKEENENAQRIEELEEEIRAIKKNIVKIKLNGK